MTRFDAPMATSSTAVAADAAGPGTANAPMATSSTAVAADAAGPGTANTPMATSSTARATPPTLRARPSPCHVRRRTVLDVPLAMTDYDGAMDVMDDLVARRERGYVCAVATHAVMVSRDDPEMHAALIGSSLTVPDGMPLVWAANWLGERLGDRVYGPELMRRYCARCADQGHRVWLYGGRDASALEELSVALQRDHPGIDIVGGWSPPFRPLTPGEEDDLLRRLRLDRPDVLWVGTGVPRQEKWMAQMRPRAEVPVMCAVGAAFDFHAGRVPQAPPWMQRRGLEWVYRMVRDPRRLVPRYLYYNPRFVAALARQLWRERGGRASVRR